jgi:simple sugar transport system ATP-binding protein
MASSRFVYGKVREIAAGGTAVILFSSGLDELLELSTRIIVLYRGRIAADLRPPFSKTLTGQYMLSGAAV